MFSFVILLNQLRNIAMKRIITLFGAFALLTNLNSFSYAQALEDFKPSSVNQLGKAYPQVNSEGRVRAQLYAPEAKKVQLDIGGVKYDMIKRILDGRIRTSARGFSLLSVECGWGICSRSGYEIFLWCGALGEWN